LLSVRLRSRATLATVSGRYWIKSAIKHPGALRASMHVKKGKRIPGDRLRAAARKGGVTGRRARLALTLRGFRH